MPGFRHLAVVLVAGLSVVALPGAAGGSARPRRCWSPGRARANLLLGLSVNTAGDPGNAGSAEPVISGNGSYVTFASDATNFSPNDTNNHQDVFLRDLLAGTTTCVSCPGNLSATHPDISASGRYITFSSDSYNLVPQDWGGYVDVFVRDRTSGAIARVSLATNGRAANGPCGPSLISSNGQHELFASSATNLSPEHTLANRVYLRVGWAQ